MDPKENQFFTGIVIKTRFSSFFSFPMNKCIIFKKLSLQEKILVKIIDHINK